MVGQAPPQIPLYPPLEKGEQNPPFSKGGYGGIQPAIPLPARDSPTGNLPSFPWKRESRGRIAMRPYSGIPRALRLAMTNPDLV